MAYTPREPLQESSGRGSSGDDRQPCVALVLTSPRREASIDSAMDPKPRPNHDVSIRVLRTMSSDQRLRCALELGEWSRKLFEQGLRRRYPALPDEEFHRLLLERFAKCHNRNY